MHSPVKLLECLLGPLFRHTQQRMSTTITDTRTTRTTTTGITIAKISVSVDSAGSLVDEGSVGEGVGEGVGEEEGGAEVGPPRQVGILRIKLMKMKIRAVKQLVFSSLVTMATLLLREDVSNILTCCLGNR